MSTLPWKVRKYIKLLYLMMQKFFVTNCNPNKIVESYLSLIHKCLMCILANDVFKSLPASDFRCAKPLEG